MNEPITTVTVADPRKGWTSASSAPADLLCTGRFLAQRGLPDVKGEYSETGTRIHAALADSGDVQFMASLTLPERETFDSCREIEKKKIIEFFGAEHPKIQAVRETRLWTKGKSQSLNAVIEHSGQPDVIFFCGTRAMICEYKTLLGDVPESSRNLQLRDQAVLVAENHPDLTEIGTTVIQPLATHDPEICLYTREDLKRARSEMWIRIVNSHNPNSSRVPGAVQCQWCLAKKRCVEYQRWAGGMLPAMSSILEVSVEEWTPEQRVLFMDRAKVAQQWLDDCLDGIKRGLERDAAFVPGWFLKPGNEMASITNPQVCFERFAALGGKLSQFMDCITVGKTKLRESVNKLTGARGKALDAAVDSITKGIVEVKQNAPSLKKVD